MGRLCQCCKRTQNQKTMNKKMSKFSEILKHHSSPTSVSHDKKEPSGKNLKHAKKTSLAKSKNPDYTQVSAYLPSSLYKKTKIKLLSNDMEFSELLELILNNWNEGKIDV